MNTQPPYQIGEIVDVTLVGVRVVNTYPKAVNGANDGTVLVFRYADRDEGSMSVNLKESAVRVTRRMPAEGCSKRGDVWVTRFGTKWFGTDDHGRMRSDHDEFAYQDSIHASPEGPLSLLYRQPAEQLGEPQEGDTP